MEGIDYQKLEEICECTPEADPDPELTAKLKVEGAVREIIDYVGENSEREGLLDTPDRVARMYYEVTEGYRVDPHSLINDALFTVDYDEMVLVKDIDFYSLCEHHLLPFIGRAHVAYIPSGGKIVGHGELAKAVEILAKRLQVQERLTTQLADLLVEKLKPNSF